MSEFQSSAGSAVSVLPATLPSCYIFSSKEETERSFPGARIVSKIVTDPSYDPSFNSIISTNEREKKFLMSFLNGIYFPDAGEDDEKIREVIALQNDSFAYRCFYFKAGSEASRKDRAFDIGMQRTASGNFLCRLMQYGFKMYLNNRVNVRVLGLMNSYTSSNAFYDGMTSCHTWSQVDPESGRMMTTLRNCPIEVNIIDLSDFRISNKMYVNCKKLGIVGISWLKLFGIRQWCPSMISTRYEIFYPEDIIDPTLKEAFHFLQV